MSVADVDAYLAAAPEPQRSTLYALRDVLVALVPDGDQGVAYGVPCLRVGGRPVAGFGFTKQHCSYYPMSGAVTAALADELTGYVTSKGAVHFAAETPLPVGLVQLLVDARRREIDGGTR